MSDIEWVDPPPPSSTENRVMTFIEHLKTRPGVWAKYSHTYTASSFSAMYNEKYPGTEWTSRKRPDGRYDAYARWVGDT